MYDETGRGVVEKNQHFFLEQDGKTLKDLPFDMMIRDMVTMLLKYRGNFKNLIASIYFIDEERKNEFFYQSSPKVPFYYMYETSPNIKKELMAKFLENPINPMMFVTYD